MNSRSAPVLLSMPDPKQKIVVIAGEQAGGTTFALHPISRERVRTSFPNSMTIPSLFIGSDTEQGLKSHHGVIWGQIAQLLTGLSPEEISQLGSLVIYYPSSGLHHEELVK